MDKAQAHTGLVRFPSAAAGGICQDCHGEIVATFVDSTHYTLQGIRDSLERFAHPGVLDEEGPLRTAFYGNCYKCHSTCGSCHVSRPAVFSGGLHSQHTFTRTPPMGYTCYGCHGARTAGEYMGRVGFATDIHYTMGMHCIDCHEVSNFHGAGKEEQNNLPRCLDCHDNVFTESNILAHQVHSPDTMSCQVCHASANNNCFDCHTTLQADGSVSADSASQIMFKIGLNPNPTEERPYRYITIRHIPTTADTFAQFGGELPNFDLIPNWKYSATHNIQRSTIQNESCDSCHGNEFIFLREVDLRKSDSEASRQLVVHEIP